MNDSAETRTQTQVETRSFDAEVSQLLKLMINALYSNREIFLRELVSNASDALDKLRFEALTDDRLHGLDQDPRIVVEVDKDGATLVVEDNGIGMRRDEVVDNLGTIARSGTARFLEQLSGDRRTDAKLIGQFGVGFYSSFIVAERVEVETRRAGEPPEAAVRWASDGKGSYTLEPVERAAHGTRVVLHLAEDHRDLLEAGRVRSIVQHYSNHVSFPIRVSQPGDEQADEPVNDTQALWTRPKAEIDEAEYKEFYQGLTGDMTDPATWAHHHVEGGQSYSMLLFVPERAPFDLAWNRDDRRGLKLYIQRVFIMDAAEKLLPRYLRFVRGVVDSADLPLNVSREILQDSPLLDKIRATVVRRSLDMIERLAEAGGEAWAKFQREFGNVLKEGVIDDHEQRERVARLLRFASTETPEPHSVSLDDYVQRAAVRDEGNGKQTGNEAGEESGEESGESRRDPIWYLTGDSLAQLKASPHLEAFRRAGVEVLLLDQPIDGWLVGHLHEFEGRPLKSAASGEFQPEQPDRDIDEDAEKALCGEIKKALGERVGNVVPSRRLTDSACCLKEPADGMTLQMRRMLRQAGQEIPEPSPDLEINAAHPLLDRFRATNDDNRRSELAHVLLDQALLIDGGELADPAGFVRRVNNLLGD